MVFVRQKCGLVKMSRIAFPTTSYHLPNLVYGGNAAALSFLGSLLLIYGGRFGPYAPRYLLKCLQHVASSNFGTNDGYATLQLLGRCALRNKNALRHLIDLLHKCVRYTLRAKAMNYLINYVSDSPKPPGRSVFVSLKRLAYDLDRGDYPESSYNLQMEVLDVLDSFVKRSLHNKLLLVKCVTGIYAHDLQIYMQLRASDAPNLKRERSMDPVSTEDLAWIDSDPDAEEILRAMHNVVYI